MDSVPRLRGRGREFAVLAAAACASVALGWAGATVNDGLATAGEVAVARLSSAVEETVKAEWQRMLRASELPVEPAGEVFRWKLGRHVLFDLSFDGRESWTEPPGTDPGSGEPLEWETLVDPQSGEMRLGSDAKPHEPSVYRTLLEEAERRELVEHDDAGALELVLEALEKGPDKDSRPYTGWLRALQLAARLGRDDVVRAQWERLSETEALPESAEFFRLIPCRVLAWMSLPTGLQRPIPPSTVLDDEQLERLAIYGDRLDLGSIDEPSARFELSPMAQVVCERMGLELPPFDRRKVDALERVGALPQNVIEDLWTLQSFAGRPLLLRREDQELTAFFYRPDDLRDSLREHSALPAGFHLDFEGDREELGLSVRPRALLIDFNGDSSDTGKAVQPRQALPSGGIGFTLRHSDPSSLGKAEASRLKLLRGALFALAFACAAGGVLTARLLARQRKLAALKTAFVAGVSHDLRTPLSAILLLTENLESGAAGADPTRTHQALRKEATRLRRLVDDVLDFSRMERGQATRIEREDVELGAFLDELAAEFGARVEAAGRPFEFQRGPLPASANLDAHAVRRALENLLDNALKHGAGTVRLGCAAADGHLRFTVADDGPGVPAAERERAFEPFERLGATNGHVGGTGLGLAIVRAIARGHGGEARICDAVAGVGAVFELDLPLEEPA
ncbi:MAG: HAMP domain-containing histidine kinase [Planctomycetes bacterium]|nr:HAMP domain-containing histidine kinase [Planctomycetota bacterium]